MSELTRAMQELPSFFAKGSVELTDIHKAETMLGLTFAEEYVDYVREYGFVTFRGHELTGICEAKRLSVVDVTEEEREYNPLIPHDLYVIEQTHIDDIVIWQDKSGKIYESMGKEPRVIANSLKEYLNL